MTQERIGSHADLRTLEARSDEHMLVNLVSLDSVRIARESYALLYNLMERRSWLCPQLDLLSLVAGLALELHKVKHDLLPKLQEANLEWGDLKALLRMKHSAMTLLCLGKDFEAALRELGGSPGEDPVSARVKELGVLLKDIAVQVLKGARDIVFVKARVPCLLGLVNALLETPVRFS